MVMIGSVGGYWLEDDALELAIRGAYLREFGFEAGSRVVIEVTQGQIVVKLIDAED